MKKFLSFFFVKYIWYAPTCICITNGLLRRQLTWYILTIFHGEQLSKQTAVHVFDFIKIIIIMTLGYIIGHVICFVMYKYEWWRKWQRRWRWRRGLLVLEKNLSMSKVWAPVKNDVSMAPRHRQSAYLWHAPPSDGWRCRRFVRRSLTERRRYYFFRCSRRSNNNNQSETFVDIFQTFSRPSARDGFVRTQTFTRSVERNNNPKTLTDWNCLQGIVPGGVHTL